MSDDEELQLSALISLMRPLSKSATEVEHETLRLSRLCAQHEARILSLQTTIDNLFQRYPGEDLEDIKEVCISNYLY